MKKLTDRVSYLQGVADGMKLDPARDSHRLLMEILGVLGDMAARIDAQSAETEELRSFIETVDEDLADLEDAFFEDAEDPEPPSASEQDEDDDDDDLIRYTCPSCGCRLTFRASAFDLDEHPTCPDCNHPLFPELQDDEEDEEAPEMSEDAD